MPRSIRTLGCAGAVLGAVLAGHGAARAEGVTLRPGPGLFADADKGPLVRPEGVACSPSTIVAADTGNGRFVVYALSEGAAAPRAAFKLPEVPVPIRVRLDGKDAAIALDGRSLRLARIDLTGRLLGFVPVASPGKASPVVRSFDVGADGTLAVLDLAGPRVLIEDRSGAPLGEVALPPACRFPSDVALGADGRIYVLDAVGARVFSAARGQAEAAPWGASLAEDLAFATSLAVDPSGRVFVVDQNGGGIVVLGPDGSFRGRQAGMGWTQGRLRWPASICVDGRGGIAVADRENNRIATFTVAP